MQYVPSIMSHAGAILSALMQPHLLRAGWKSPDAHCQAETSEPATAEPAASRSNMPEAGKAMKALARVRGQPHDSEYVLHELAEIQANYEYELQIGKVSWLGCFSGGILTSNSNARKVFIGTAIQMFQQLTGINFII